MTGSARGASLNLLACSPLVSYVALAYLITWGIGLPLLAARRGWWALQPGDAWEGVAAFGPLIAAVVVCGVSGGRTAIRSLLQDATRWRVGARWLLVSLGSPLVLLGAAVVIVRLTTGDWPQAPTRNAPFGDVAGIASLVLASGLAQAIGEEPGWRGFMLPRLRLRFGVLAATLALFPAWLLWHLPSFLGRPEYGIAQWLAFSVGILSASVWLTLIREHASTLMAIGWHALINIARGIALAISAELFVTMSVLVLAVALVIAACWLWADRRRGRVG